MPEDKPIAPHLFEEEDERTIYYRLMFHNNPNPMWLADRETLRFLDVNEAALSHYGYTREEMLAMSIADIVLPADLPAAMHATVSPEGKAFAGIRRHRTSGGRVRLMEVHTNIITFGNKSALLGTGNDVTERERSQDNLRRKEAALALAQQVAHLGSWEVDLVDLENEGSNPFRCSDETCRIFGYEPGDVEVSFELFRNAIHPADRERVSAAYRRMLRSAGRYSVDHRIRLPGGAQRVVHQEARLIFEDDPDHPAKVAGTVQDITERNAAEERLREQAELLDRSPDAIMVHDLAGHITYWNRGAESIYGWTAAEAIGQSAVELLHAEPDRHDPARLALAGRGEWVGELRQVRKDGKQVILNSRWTLLKNAAGEEKSVLVFSSDITEHKKLESQLLRAQRLESIGTLASGVAHDLNNILAPILMSASVLREDLSPDQRSAILDNIETSAQRGADMVRQVLTFARGAEGERYLVQPVHLIKEITKIAQQTFPKSIEVREWYSPGSWVIEGVPAQLHQVLLNLCVNARDAMPDGGELALSVENLTVDEQYAAMMPGVRPGPHIVIQVSDTGSGIPGEILDKIFDPFFTTKEMGKGTGLGLSTVVGIVKSHGGFITVYSEVGRGTNFKVFLPAAGEAPAGAERPELQEPMRGNGELLLIVDDESNILEIAKTILQSHGYRVAAAKDGPEALAIFAEQKQAITLVITDVVMPLLDGMTLIRTLRKMNAAVPIIASTSRNDEKRMNELKAMGVSVCLAKPYNKQTLLFAVGNALALRHGAPNRQGELWRGGRRRGRRH
jgi:PAS domain S-box-containing protein